jgi:hypothetical protein
MTLPLTRPDAEFQLTRSPGLHFPFMNQMSRLVRVTAQNLSRMRPALSVDPPQQRLP